MHDGQEEDLNSCLDCHRFDINQLREDHNPLPLCAPLVPIEEVMIDAKDLDSVAERAEQALDEECQGHSTQCSQRDECLFCGQTSPTSHCQ